MDQLFFVVKVRVGGRTVFSCAPRISSSSGTLRFCNINFSCDVMKKPPVVEGGFEFFCVGVTRSDFADNLWRRGTESSGRASGQKVV